MEALAFLALATVCLVVAVVVSELFMLGDRHADDLNVRGVDDA